MGKHIEVISEKLKQLEAGTIKRLMVFCLHVVQSPLSAQNCFQHGI